MDSDSEPCIFFDDSGTQIDDAIAKMAKLGEEKGFPNGFVGPSSSGYFCYMYSKSGVKWNGSLDLEVPKKVLIEGKGGGPENEVILYGKLHFKGDYFFGALGGI